jgi:hypothetical protein
VIGHRILYLRVNLLFELFVLVGERLEPTAHGDLLRSIFVAGNNCAGNDPQSLCHLDRDWL